MLVSSHSDFTTASDFTTLKLGLSLSTVVWRELADCDCPSEAGSRSDSSVLVLGLRGSFGGLLNRCPGRLVGNIGGFLRGSGRFIGCGLLLYVNGQQYGQG